MEIQVSSRYDRRDMEALLRASDRRFCRREAQRMRLCAFLAGAVVLSISPAAMVEGSPAASVLCAVVGGVFVAWGALAYSIAAWSAVRRLPRGDHSVAFTFREGSFTACGATEKEERPYDALHSVVEEGDYFFLFLAPQLGYIVDKRGLAPGEAETLRALLRGGGPAARRNDSAGLPARETGGPAWNGPDENHGR